MRRVAARLAPLALAAALGGCAIDDATGEVKGPVYVGQLIGWTATHSRAVPTPPEWPATCAQDFAVHWPGARPAPDGVIVYSVVGVSIAEALGRAGAAYAELMARPEDAAAAAELFPTAGRYRIARKTASAACDAWLEGVIKAWQSSNEALRRGADACLTITRTGDYHPLPQQIDDQVGLFEAPYFTRGTTVTQALQGGAFELSQHGEDLVDRRTGRPVATWTSSAFLAFHEPDRDHAYWGEQRVCGPNSGHVRQTWLLHHRLFAAG